MMSRWFIAFWITAFGFGFQLWAIPKLGESLYFDLNYSGLTIGYLQVEVKASYPLETFFQSGNGIIARDYFKDILVQNTSSNYSIYWLKVNSNVTQLDKDEDIYILEPDGFPLIFKQTNQQGLKTLTFMHPLEKKLTLHSATGVKENRKYKSPVFDPISLFYYLRTKDFSREYSLSTIDQSFEFKKAGEETLNFKGKNFKTMVVKSVPAKITFWFSNDSQRLPLKVQYDMFMGSVFFELRI